MNPYRVSAPEAEIKRCKTPRAKAFLLLLELRRVGGPDTELGRDVLCRALNEFSEIKTPATSTEVMKHLDELAEIEIIRDAKRLLLYPLSIGLVLGAAMAVLAWILQ